MRIRKLLNQIGYLETSTRENALQRDIEPDFAELRDSVAALGVEVGNFERQQNVRRTMRAAGIDERWA